MNGRSNGAPVPRLRAAPKPSNAQAVHGSTSTGTSDHTNSAHGEHPELLSPATSTTLSPTTPPYWINSNIHQRSRSNVSVESIPAGAITLQDNENNLDNDRNNACWARSVEIIDHIIVNGSTTNIGAFVVWIIKVETLTVCHPELDQTAPRFTILIYIRENTGELYEHPQTILRVRRLPQSACPLVSKLRGGGTSAAPKECHLQIPAEVPRKAEGRAPVLSQVSKIASRDFSLSYSSHLLTSPLPSCILLNPEFSGSPVLKNFLFK